MRERQDFLDVQPIFARPPIFRDPVNQDRDFWHGRIHAVQQGGVTLANRLVQNAVR